MQAHLIIWGCTPPARHSHERMTVIPFLNKSDPSQRVQLERLFDTSDFFFLPTRSECYGMVFCEASAYGLPVITTNTGGVSGAVTNGENGFMLPLSAEAVDYAGVIAKVYRDDQLYAELVRSGAGEAERLELLKRHREEVRRALATQRECLKLLDTKIGFYSAALETSFRCARFGRRSDLKLSTMIFPRRPACPDLGGVVNRKLLHGIAGRPLSRSSRLRKITRLQSEARAVFNGEKGRAVKPARCLL